MRRILLPTTAAAAVAVLLAAPGLPPAEARDAAGLRLLTWNAGTVNPFSIRLQDRDVPRVVAAIADSDVAVACLQEVASTAQVTRIREALAGRGLAFHARSHVVDPEHPDGLSVVLSRERPRAHLRRRLDMGLWVHGARFAEVTVLVVHAPSKRAAQRADYFREALAWAATLPGPVVLAGDFNLGPSGGAGTSLVWPPHRRVDRETYEAIAARLPVGNAPTPTNFLGWRIDHVRASQGRLVGASVLRGRRRFPMDHDPLLVELDLAARRVGISARVGAPTAR